MTLSYTNAMLCSGLPKDWWLWLFFFCGTCIHIYELNYRLFVVVGELIKLYECCFVFWTSLRLFFCCKCINIKSNVFNI